MKRKSEPPAAARRAALYCRVSTQEQGQRGYSLGAQEQDDRALAAELGAAVVAVYQDQDSGASWDLPGLNALLDAAKRSSTCCASTTPTGSPATWRSS